MIIGIIKKFLIHLLGNGKNYRIFATKWIKNKYDRG